MNNIQLNQADTIKQLAYTINNNNYYVEKNTPKKQINLKGIVLNKKYICSYYYKVFIYRNKSFYHKNLG